MLAADGASPPLDLELGEREAHLVGNVSEDGSVGPGSTDFHGKMEDYSMASPKEL